MVVQVSSADPRSLKALAILAASDRWTRGHRKEDGRPFFSMPGSEGRIYWVDCRSRTCPDFARNSQLEMGFACKHVLAVRMWKLARDGESKNAPKPKARKAPICTVCGGPVPDGVIVGTCNKPACFDADDVFQGVAGIKALFGATDRDAVIQTI